MNAHRLLYHSTLGSRVIKKKKVTVKLGGLRPPAKTEQLKCPGGGVAECRGSEADARLSLSLG